LSFYHLGQTRLRFFASTRMGQDQVAKERLCRTQGSVNGGPAHHRWKVRGDLVERHDRLGVQFRGMGQLFQGGEGLFTQRGKKLGPFDLSAPCFLEHSEVFRYTRAYACYRGCLEREALVNISWS